MKLPLFMMEQLNSLLNVRSLQVFEFKPPEGTKYGDIDPDLMTEKIKKVAGWFGADVVGICILDMTLVYSHICIDIPYQGPGDGSKHTSGESFLQEIPNESRYAIVLGFEMDYEVILCYSNYVSNAATARGYSQMDITAAYLSDFIKALGYKVNNSTTNDVALAIPMTMKAGLGDLGRNGLLITPKYGLWVRIAQLITDLPLVPDSPIDFGVTEFSNSCWVCAERCPSQSIHYGDRTTDPINKSNAAGGLKWPGNGETCRMYWSRKKIDRCVCINVCPFNKPDTLFHRLVR